MRVAGTMEQITGLLACPDIATRESGMIGLMSDSQGRVLHDFVGYGPDVVSDLRKMGLTVHVVATTETLEGVPEHLRSAAARLRQRATDNPAPGTAIQ
jgi:hypothetical protein